MVMSTHDMGDAQLLCDRILLIDKGARLLYGTVTDVRAAFRDGAVVVAGRGIATDPAAYRSVSHITAHDGVLRFLLHKASNPAAYVQHVEGLYRPTKDFRVLECLADGVP